jgi:hypothetical protein
MGYAEVASSICQHQSCTQSNSVPDQINERQMEAGAINHTTIYVLL